MISLPSFLCRYALRDVLVDLGAFHLMSSSTASSIANELMGYWLLLTEGRYYPLRMMVMIR